MKNPPTGYTVRPVFATTQSIGFSYASDFEPYIHAGTATSYNAQVSCQSGDIFLGLDLSVATLLHQKYLLEAFKRLGVKIHIVVYDLLPIQHPDAFPYGEKKCHEDWLQVVLHAHNAHCISRSVATDLLHWKNKNNHQYHSNLKIDWFHLGADIENSLSSTGLPSDVGDFLSALKNRPTFLMVGTLEPRKKHGQALDAFELLWSQGIDTNLIIVGKQGWLVPELVLRLQQHPELKTRLHWLEGISDEYLETVYSASTCLLATSVGEGFGLPLIEAARRGLAIIARDIPIFREVANGHAHYYSGDSGEDLAVSIADWLKLNAGHMAPSSHGMEWLTWEESARKLIQVVLEEGSAQLE